MNKEEAKGAIKEVYGNSEYTYEIIETLEQPKTGYWIKYDKQFCVVDRLRSEIRPIRECSECHDWAEDDSDYCPYCGCRMEE